MATMRNWCSALFLVPLSLLASHAASAAGPVGPVGVTSSTVGAKLPPGIHLTRSGRYTRDLCDHSKPHFCMSQVLLPEGWTPAQAVPPRVRQGGGGGGGGASGMAPSDILAAYAIPSGTSANGKIVAILDGPDSSAFSDLTQYRGNYNLPTMNKCVGNPTGSLPACFAQVNENGGASTGQDAGEDSDAETSLDMDMISAACPDCSILLVEIGGTNSDIQDSDFVTGVQTANSLGAVATSISIGGPEQGDPSGNNYTVPGHLVFAASGDFGYDSVDEGANTPSYPASAPDIIAVGGTTLFASGSSYGEAVWNDGDFTEGENGQDVTTSGCSTEYSAPSWQSAVLSGTSCSRRATADISAAAAFYSSGQNTDIAVYQDGWQAVEGTSAASPMVAAILTRLGLAETISSNLGWPYANTAAFNDLGSSSYPVDSSGSDTDSSDPSSCGKLCTAGTGWDGPSGVGTPNGTRLSAAAGNPTPPPGMDAGTPPTSTPDSGTPGNPPPTTGDGGSSTSIPPGSGPGSTTISTAPPGSLGYACTSPSQCDSNLCAEPNAGAPSVCTQACNETDAGPTCLLGFSCTQGYCFASLNLTAPTAGADAGTSGDADSGSSGGCSVSSSGGSDWVVLGWLSLGLVVVGKRRRRAKAG